MGTVAAVIGEYPKHLSSHPKMNSESLKLRGTLRGHSGWGTQIATNPKFPDMILSASRDKTLIVWKLTREENNYGVPRSVCMATLTSSLTLFCPRTVTSPCLDHGTRLCACGISPLESPPAASKTTPRMS